MASMVWPARGIALLGLASLVLAFPSGALADPPVTGPAANVDPAAGSVATAPTNSGPPPPGQVVTINVPAEPVRPARTKTGASPPPPPPPAATTTPTTVAPRTPPVTSPSQSTPPPSRPALQSQPRARGGPSVDLTGGGRVASPLAIVPRWRDAQAVAVIPKAGGSSFTSRVRQAPRWLVGVAAVLVAAECMLLAGFAYRRWLGPTSHWRTRRRLARRS